MSEGILVIGSMNMDLVVQTKNFPEKGETVVGKNFAQAPGGKGANQALAAAKLGSEVKFIGACGNDYFGEEVVDSLKAGGVNTEDVQRLDVRTGIANITVEEDGDNRIIIVPGANNQLRPELIAKHENEIKEAELILLQLEIPIETIEEIIDLAAQYETKVLLDPAPVKDLTAEIYSNVDYLLPNEGELESLFPNLESRGARANKLLELGVDKVLLTKGKQGITLYSTDKIKNYGAVTVDAVDTTAAGDAFAGGFAHGLQQGWSEEEAINFASQVAALSVTKEGAQPSLPTTKEVRKFKQQRGLEE